MKWVLAAVSFVVMGLAVNWMVSEQVAEMTVEHQSSIGGAEVVPWERYQLEAERGYGGSLVWTRIVPWVVAGVVAVMVWAGMTWWERRRRLKADQSLQHKEG